MYYLIIAADITIFTYGMQTGWMSPSIQVLQGPNSPSGYPLSDYEISWIAGTVTIVAVFFCLGFSVVCDRYGRRMSLVLVAVTQAVRFLQIMFVYLCICLDISAAHITGSA